MLNGRREIGLTYNGSLLKHMGQVVASRVVASVRTSYRLSKKGATAFYVKVLFSTDLKMKTIGTIPTVSKW